MPYSLVKLVISFDSGWKAFANFSLSRLSTHASVDTHHQECKHNEDKDLYDPLLMTHLHHPL